MKQEWDKKTLRELNCGGLQSLCFMPSHRENYGPINIKCALTGNLMIDTLNYSHRLF